MIHSVRSLEESDVVSKAPSDESAGFGALSTERGCLPLVALDVRARLSGLTAHTTVRQSFRNSLDVPLEATYIFPLPDRAAARSFRLKVADRVVEGVLKERGEAREEYEKAIEAGHRAAIAEEDRSGTFSLRVGNIPAKEEVEVELTLIGPLPVADGEATYRFPLVVAPRYVSGIPLDGPSVGPGREPDTDAVPDASRVTPPVLLPGFPNPVRLSLEVELDPAGLFPATADWSSRIRSSLHSVILEDGPPWTVRLKPGERLNRDFILWFPVAGDAVQTSLVASPASSDGPGTFALTIVPPALTAENRPKPRELVIALDRSGSMGGWKMVAARRAVGRIVETLLEQDRFTIMAFDNVVEYPSHANGKLVEASDRQRWRALEWLAGIEARGGTEMGPALETAVRLLSAEHAACERIVVLVTDGQVAGEDAVLRQLKRLAGSAIPRIHTVGIDQAVNAGFLQRLADLGRGGCDLVESEDRLDEAMDRIHRALGSPVLTDLRIEGVGCEWIAESLAPSRLPDLFADRPVTIYGRVNGDASSLRLGIHARDAAGHPWGQEVSARAGAADILAGCWGRAKVRELEDRYAAGEVADPQALMRQIVEISLASQVLSRFTAFVAVDRSEVVNPTGRTHQVVQPVEMPEGWDIAMPCAMAAGGVERLLHCCFGGPIQEARGPVLSKRKTRSQAKKMSKTSAAPPPASRAPIREPAAIVAEIRKAIEAMVAALADKPQDPANWCPSALKRLMQLLAELAIAVPFHLPAAAPAVEAVLENGQKLTASLAAAAAGSDDLTRLAEFLASVRTMLDALEPKQPAAAPRKRFWT
jgi:Ca-activated chloride channel family protein